MVEGEPGTRLICCACAASSASGGSLISASTISGNTAFRGAGAYLYSSPVTLSNSTPPHLSDSAVLSGGFNPTGTITITLTAPDGNTVLYTDHITVTGNGNYDTTMGDHPGGYALPTAGAVTGGLSVPQPGPI